MASDWRSSLSHNDEVSQPRGLDLGKIRIMAHSIKSSGNLAEFRGMLTRV